MGVSHPKKEPQAYLETTVCERVPGSACLGCLGCDQGGLQCASLCFCAWVCVCVLGRSPASAACRLRAVPSLFAERTAAKPESDSSRHTWKGKDTKWKKQQIEFGISWSAAAFIALGKLSKGHFVLYPGDNLHCQTPLQRIFLLVLIKKRLL